uniref:Sulfatase domain-containing protein n=1 Tax=Rhabditophanes sp. KR3021 TaxID=114890 RepID=A0AC35TKI5_9BILA
MWKIFPYDDEFAEFFKTNEKAFDDSFLFVMGDHGHRMASFSYTPEGRYERNNPYFYVSVPKNLRDNKELRKNLNDNTNKHTSHFDTYATILDILTEAGRTNFTNLKPFDLSTIVNDTIKGKSLFRPIDESTRDCYNMLVPSRYCLCEPKFNPLLSNASINIKNYLQDAFTKEINLKLENDNLKDKCALMFLDPKEPFKVEYTITKTLKLVFKVDAVTSPGKAKYLAYFDEDMRLISPEITRQNVYKDQAEVCEKISEFRKYCYCKSLLRKNEIVKSIN